MDNQSKSENDEHIESFISERSDRSVRFEEVNSFIRDKFSNQKISPATIYKLLVFAAEQQGRWQCKWFFSPISDSDIDARDNMEGYFTIWKASAESITNIDPNAYKILNEQRKLLNLKYSMERRLEETKNKSILTFRNVVLSKVSFFLNSIGFTNLSDRLYAIALFPSGSVGHEQ
jgi:hypothetical protein